MELMGEIGGYTKADLIALAWGSKFCIDSPPLPFAETDLDVRIQLSPSPVARYTLLNRQSIVL